MQNPENTDLFDRLANPWIAGLGTYEPGRPIEEVARDLGFNDASDILKLASNENLLGPSPLAMEAIREHVSSQHVYPDGGAFYLRRALAKRHDLEMEKVLPCNGSNEAIELLAHVFLGPHKSMVMGSHAFVVYRLVAALAQAETIAVPMPDFVHDLDQMLEAIQLDTRLLFIANPNNPTGTVVTQDALDRFMDQVPDHVAVVLDEAYIDLLTPEQQPDTLRYVRENRRVFLLRTFSKTYGLAGLRVGYVMGPESGIQLLNKVRQPFHVNALAQVAAMAALRDEDFVNCTRRMVQDGLSQLGAACDQLGLDYVPSVTNFLLVKTGRGREICQALQQKRVIVRPMDGYGLPEYIRVTLGTQEQNDNFVAALTDVLNANVITP